MRWFLLIFLWMIFQTAFSQENRWNKVVIDSNLVIDLPGVIEKPDSLKYNQYAFRIFSSRSEKSLFTVMVSAKEANLDVNNNDDYKKALDGLVKGATESATKKNYHPVTSEIICNKVPGRKVILSGDFNGIHANMYSHLFLVNDYVYTISAYFYKDSVSAKDTQTINKMLSSIHFTADIREQQFLSKSMAVGYKIGELIGSLVVIGLIILVVIFVVRRFV